MTDKVNTATFDFLSEDMADKVLCEDLTDKVNTAMFDFLDEVDDTYQGAVRIVQLITRLYGECQRLRDAYKEHETMIKTRETIVEQQRERIAQLSAALIDKCREYDRLRSECARD